MLFETTALPIILAGALVNYSIYYVIYFTLAINSNALSCDEELMQEGF